MPSSYDIRPVAVTNDPTQRLDLSMGKMPPIPNFLELLADWIDNVLIKAILDLTGIDLKNPETWPIIGDLIEVLTGVEDGNLNDLGTWVNNILRSLRDAAEALAALLAPVPVIGDILEVISGKEDGDIHDAGTAINNMIGDINGTLQGIWNGVTQTLGYGPITQDNAAAAISSQTQALVGMNAAIAQLVAALGTGNPDSDDFERSDADDLGAGIWTVLTNGTGNYSIDGHNASFSFPNTLGFAVGEAIAIKNGSVSKADNGVVSVVLASASDWQPFLLPSAFGCVDLWGRMYGLPGTFGNRTGVRARFSADNTVRLDYYSNGTEFPLVPPVTLVNPPAGAVLQLFYGVGGNPRRYMVYASGKPVIDFTESSPLVLIGPNYRHRGIGACAVDLGELVPVAAGGKLMQWTAQG